MGRGRPHGEGAHRRVEEGVGESPDCKRERFIWTSTRGALAGGDAGGGGEGGVPPAQGQGGGRTRRRGRCRPPGLRGLGLAAVLLLMWVGDLGSGGVGGQDALTTARLEVGDLFNLRKAMSGESAFPYRYRSYVRGEDEALEAALDGCCAGAGCTECADSGGEQVENLRATKYELQRDIGILQGLGCPCTISSIFPSSGGYLERIPVELDVAGLQVDAALERGGIECWWRRIYPGEVETYIRRPAAAVAGSNSKVTCDTPPQTGPIFLDVSLHGEGWAVTHSAAPGGNVFDMYDAGNFSITSVTPSGSPSSGGTVLTVVGLDFDVTRELQIRVAGVRFPGTMLNSTHAVCTTPELPTGATELTLSQNGYDWIQEAVPFGVYTQPVITVLYPSGGTGNEAVRMNLAGLGLAFEPRDEDLYCRWFLIDRNETVRATRLRNSSTIECQAPNNTLGQHFLTGSIPVEVTLIGTEQQDLFTSHPESASNKYTFGCRSQDVLYAGLLDFFPQCTSDKCCPAGYPSSNGGTNCTQCGTNQYSFTGATFCYDCPVNSEAPPGSPDPGACICKEGYVGQSGGLIATPSDQCVTCGANQYAYTTTERTTTPLSQTVWNSYTFATSASCVSCPAKTHSAGGVTSVTAWDCLCDPGYICSVGDQTCDQWKASLNLTWSTKTCEASNHTQLPSEVEVNACKTAGLADKVHHGPPGDRRVPCVLEGDGCDNKTEPCICSCAHAIGYVNGTEEVWCDDGEGAQVAGCKNRTNETDLSDWYCQDVDECLDTVNPHTCTLPNQVCLNRNGRMDESLVLDPGWNCSCADGWVWNGTWCNDVDECSLPSHDCHANAACSNTAGSFSCDCIRGHFGDGLLDCSDGTQKTCSTVFEVSATTAGGSACWATPSNLTSLGAGGDFYCDSDADTANQITLKIFWLELQGWSEEITLSAAGMAQGETVEKLVFGLSFTGEPAMVQYRVKGADAWHPSQVQVRPFGGDLWYSVTGDLCWVHGNACSEEACYAQPDCGDAIAPSRTYDFDECALGTSQCSDFSNCTNNYGKYTCDCFAGYRGLGTGVAGSGTLCEECAAGTYAEGSGQTACLPCPDQTTGPQGSTSSTNCFCAPGTYGEIVGSSSQCTECPEARYCPGGPAAYACPEGAWSPARSIHIDECVCQPGYYGLNGQACTVCPSGYSCEGGWQQPVECLANTHAAPGSSVCSACSGNSTSGLGALTCTCAEGDFDSSYFGKFSSGTCWRNGCEDIGLQSTGVCEQAATALGLTYGADASVGTTGCHHSTVNVSGTLTPMVRPGEYPNCTADNECVCQRCSPAVCQTCGASEYSGAGAYVCQQCTANATSDAGSTVVTDCSCSPGSYGTITDASSTCLPCAAGQFSGTAGSSACGDCPAGSYAPYLGSSACEVCTALATSPPGSTSASQCECAAGTTGDAQSGGCSNVDECGGGHNCGQTGAATCTDTDGSFTCACDATYFGDGVDCALCPAGSGCPGGAAAVACTAGFYSVGSASSCSACPANSTSPPQSVGVANCTCDAGYNSSSAGGGCSNVDECAAGASDCDVAAACTDTDGSFTCACPGGEAGLGTVSAPCPSECGDGLRGGLEACDDNNTASGDGCSITCTVESGFTCSVDFPSVCADDDECAAFEPCALNATCTNNQGSGYLCTCHEGFYGNGMVCSLCPEHSTSPNGTTTELGCACNAGYGRAPSSTHCVDVDECALGTDDCHSNASCTNAEGSFTCSCNAGYVHNAGGSGVNGTDCLDLDECALGTHTCDAQATCEDGAGSFVCRCNAGYYDVSGASVTAMGVNGSCALCPAGTYSGTLGVTECDGCPPQSVTSSLGNTQASACECNAGYAGTITTPSDTCSPCSIGTYAEAAAPSCTTCPGGATTSDARSVNVSACVCPAGTYLDGATCAQCAAVGGTSPFGSTSVSECSCDDGYYQTANSSTSLTCEGCASCDPGYARTGCGQLDAGNCVDVDECGLGTSSCDLEHAECNNTVGSFSCSCYKSFYGNGSFCSSCPANADSPNASEALTSCTCNAGFDTGDGFSTTVTSLVESCSTFLEVEVLTASGSACLTEAPNASEYCDGSAGTREDVWLRVGWADGTWTEWYVYPSIRPGLLGGGEGFNFSAGSNETLYMQYLPRVGGAPLRVEYYVAAGSDSWRPLSFRVRLPAGTSGGGGGDESGFFGTGGGLCWVGGEGIGVSQVSVGCERVAKSAVATLFGAGGGDSDTSVGILRRLLAQEQPVPKTRSDKVHDKSKGRASGEQAPLAEAKMWRKRGGRSEL